MWKKIIALIIILIGMGMAFYPWISNWMFNHRTESMVEAYTASVEDDPSIDVEAILAEAQSYNQALLSGSVVLTDPFSYENTESDSGADYNSVLNLDGSGLMCFIEIPKIDVYLPVYHGTSFEVLEKGAGHVEDTALPIGTTGGRPVISAHTGLNTAKMFSDLTDMKEGDLFFIHILNETLAYRVVGTEVIEPDDISSLSAEEGRDLVTLLTCTPYGVNSHRLLVTGERTEYTDEIRAEADALEMDSGSEWMKAYRQAILAAFCIIAAAAAVMYIMNKARSKRAPASGTSGKG